MGKRRPWWGWRWQTSWCRCCLGRGRPCPGRGRDSGHLVSKGGGKTEPAVEDDPQRHDSARGELTAPGPQKAGPVTSNVFVISRLTNLNRRSFPEQQPKHNCQGQAGHKARLRLGPLMGFLSCHCVFQGPSNSTHTLLPEVQR